MSKSVDLLDIVDKTFYYINWETLTVENEVLVPDFHRDWTWYSERNDSFLLEYEIYDSFEEAARNLLSNMI